MKILLFAFIIEIFSIIVGYYFTINYNPNWTPVGNVPELSTFDIFLHNMKTIIFLVLISLLGLVGVFLSSLVVFEVGAGIAKITSFYNVSIEKVLLAIFPHAVGELVIIGIILSRSLNATIYWINYFKYSNTISPKEFFIKELHSIVNMLFAIIPILLLSAYVEVNFSKKHFESEVLKNDI